MQVTCQGGSAPGVSNSGLPIARVGLGDIFKKLERLFQLGLVTALGLQIAVNLRPIMLIWILDQNLLEVLNIAAFTKKLRKILTGVPFSLSNVKGSVQPN